MAALLLQLTSVIKFFGAMRALKRVSFDARAVALCQPGGLLCPALPSLEFDSGDAPLKHRGAVHDNSRGLSIAIVPDRVHQMQSALEGGQNSQS
jgi:hypothetical protein